MVTGTVEACKDCVSLPYKDGKGRENENCISNLKRLVPRCSIEEFDRARPSECQEQQTRTPAVLVLVLKILIKHLIIEDAEE
jgi:hypothetical protein